MEQGPRKATDVLLELETMVTNLVGLVKSQDLNIKVLSNKLNVVMDLLQKNSIKPPAFTVEAVQKAPQQENEKNIIVEADFNLPIDNNPSGFRRTSRPETYAGDNSYLPPKTQNKPKPPPGRGETPEIIVPQKAITSKNGLVEPIAPVPQAPATPRDDKKSIPVQQRVVDRNGKSIFLADVEIFDLSDGQSIFKTRTNGTGKWVASLGIGSYRVTISKRESLTKERVKIDQDITVDGSVSLLELQMLIIK